MTTKTKTLEFNPQEGHPSFWPFPIVVGGIPVTDNYEPPIKEEPQTFKPLGYTLKRSWK